MIGKKEEVSYEPCFDPSGQRPPQWQHPSPGASLCRRRTGGRASVEIVSVADYHVHPCIGCEGCSQHPENQCVQQDDMQKIYPKLLWADVVAAASPVYFYGVSAQLKAIIDRCHTPLRNQFHIQKLALLLVGGATLPTLFDAILCQYQMILDYFRLSDGGRVLVSGVRAPGEIAGHPELQAAYALGKNL